MSSNQAATEFKSNLKWNKHAIHNGVFFMTSNIESGQEDFVISQDPQHQEQPKSYVGFAFHKEQEIFELKLMVSSSGFDKLDKLISDLKKLTYQNQCSTNNVVKYELKFPRESSRLAIQKLLRGLKEIGLLDSNNFRKMERDLLCRDASSLLNMCAHKIKKNNIELTGDGKIVAERLGIVTPIEAKETSENNGYSQGRSEEKDKYFIGFINSCALDLELNHGHFGWRSTTQKKVIRIRNMANYAEKYLANYKNISYDQLLEKKMENGDTLADALNMPRYGYGISKPGSVTRTLKVVKDKIDNLMKGNQMKNTV